MRSDSSQCGAAAADNLDEAVRRGQQPTRIKHLEQAGAADSRKRGESSGHLTAGVRATGRGFGKGRATEGFAATCPLGSRVPPHVKLEPAWLGSPVADFI